MTGRMSAGPSRRALLLAAALTAAAAPAAAGADPFDALRLRRLDIALGTGYDPAAEPYAARLARLGGTARDFHAGMAPASTSGRRARSAACPPARARACSSAARRGRSATLWISEPPRTGTPLEIVWDRPVRSVVHADDTVDVHLADRRTRLRVTPGMACAVHRCEVILG